MLGLQVHPEAMRKGKMVLQLPSTVGVLYWLFKIIG
jgi:hypothetical protein